MLRIKVYRYKSLDPATREYKVSLHMATRDAITRIGAEAIETTETEVLPSDIDGDGLTTIDFLA